MPRRKPGCVVVDWKASPGDLMDELKPILKALGVRVYSLPSVEDSDQYGFVLSLNPMTKADIVKLEREQGLRDDEEGA